MLERENQVLFNEGLGALTSHAIERTLLDGLSDPSGDTKLLEGMAICRVVGFRGSLPILTYTFNDATYVHTAIAVVGSLREIIIGSVVCAAFDQNRIERPLVLGKIACDLGKELVRSTGTIICDDEQITLKCGQASINLKADGTVSIRGTNVASRASNTNRIRGGNVQIN